MGNSPYRGYGWRRKKQPYYTSFEKAKGDFFLDFRGSKAAGDDGLTSSFVDLITTLVAQWRDQAIVNKPYPESAITGPLD